jgi:hypothetical protein
MAAELFFAPEVEWDVLEAYAWYEGRRIGLGEDFMSCVDACVPVSRNPEMYLVVYENYRRALVRRFPFSVFYEYSENTVTIYCVFHNSRDPEKWRQRLDSRS